MPVRRRSYMWRGSALETSTRVTQDWQPTPQHLLAFPRIYPGVAVVRRGNPVRQRKHFYFGHTESSVSFPRLVPADCSFRGDFVGSRGLICAWQPAMPRAQEDSRRTREDCIFCNYDPTRRIYHDHLVTAFPDINPSSYKHFLVVPNVHIDTVKDLKPGREDFELVSHMYKVGQQILEKEAPDSPKRYGFHCPPFNSVNHLHLHCFALPYNNSFRAMKYLEWPWYALGQMRAFLPVDQLLERLKPSSSSASTSETSSL